MTDPFAQRIAELIARAGGQNALARRAGLSLGAIQRYLKGGEPTRGALVRLAEAGGVSMDWLVYGDENTQAQSAAHAIPVYGFADGAKQGWYSPVKYKINATLDWPDPDLYAVVASGHGMVPDGIRPGHICIVSPNTRPQRGDAVLLTRTDGASTIRVYGHEDDAWIYVTGWLDPETENGPQMKVADQIKRSAVEKIAPVVFVKRRA